MQENETSTSVNAMKNIPQKLPVLALASDRLVHEDGRVISKAPRKEIPNTTNNTKNSKLATQLVARLFSAAGPKINVTRKPRNVKIRTMDAAYNTALRIPSDLVLLLLVKKLTVTGIMEYTQGVSSASKPPPKAAKNIHKSDWPVTPLKEVEAVSGRPAAAL